MDSAFRAKVSDLLRPSRPSAFAAKAASSEARVLGVDRKKLLATIQLVGLPEDVAWGLTHSVGPGRRYLELHRGERALKCELVQAWSGAPMPDGSGVFVTVRLADQGDAATVSAGRATASIDVAAARSAAPGRR